MAPLDSKDSTRGAVRAPVFIGVIILAGICLLAVVLLRKGPEPQAPSQTLVQKEAPEVAAPPPRENPLPTIPDPPPPNLAPTNVVSTPPPPRTGTNAAPVSGPPASAFTQELVKQLSQIGLDGGPLTPEKAEAWKGNLQRLIMEGEKGVPAIRDFLARNEDLNLSALEGGDLLGEPTLRMALLDALWQIGGQGATDLSVRTLQTASDPREIASLANYLEQQAPEQYREMAVIAARESLAMASAGQLSGRDVGPLFDVLTRYGGANVVADLQGSLSQWKYYGAISMAQLPDNQGLPALLQLAQDPNNAGTSRLVALEMLAQKAPSSQPALNALVQQARSGAIPDATWLTIASVLEGHQFGIGDVPPELQSAVSSNIKKFHLSYGNQNYYSVVPSGEWQPKEVNARIAIIDQMLAARPGDLATRALRQARGSLAARVAQ